MTNGVAEELNSTIMSIKRKAGGFRNAQNFATAIYIHCGGLITTRRISEEAHTDGRLRVPVTKNVS